MILSQANVCGHMSDKTKPFDQFTRLNLEVGYLANDLVVRPMLCMELNIYGIEYVDLAFLTAVGMRHCDAHPLLP